MTTQQLAKELRDCQAELAYVERRLIDIMPDEIIVASYNRCSCCGEDIVSETELEEIIEAADDADHFIDLLNHAALREAT